MGQTLDPYHHRCITQYLIMMMQCYVTVYVIGSPKRYGLKEAIEEKWRKIRELETHGDYHSTYSTAFR